MNSFVGIDLGTTYSVIAFINANGKPEIIPNEYGHATTPSVVYLGGEKLVVGEDAKEFQAMGKQEVASFFKRNMDDIYFMLSFNGRTTLL